MKIQVRFTVEVDQEAWATEYGVDRSEVRDDVRTYVQQSMQMHITDLGLAPGQRNDPLYAQSFED